MFKKIIIAIVAIALLLGAVLIVNTLSFTSRQESFDAIEPVTVGDEVFANLTKAIQFKTISIDENIPPDSAAFKGFHTFLTEAFPLVDSLLEKKTINDYSLLYTWEGTDQNAKPIILLSHQDVVPVDEPTLDQWEEDPYSGAVRDGKIWGRGTMDDKGTLMAILEATEMLLSESYKPKRTIYFAFGHDEELGGKNGAKAIAAYLKSQGVQAEFTLDEGGVLAEGQIPGIDAPIAVINVAEKGYVSYELTVETQGGHSSQPPKDNTIGMLARAITDLENNQRPLKIVEPLDYMIDYLGPELPFLDKMAFANSWLFGSQLAEAFNGRTTTAPTIINGGVKDNVIPTVATATVNFRILPGETSATVLDHVKASIQNDQISIKGVGNLAEPSPVSDPLSPSFKLVQKTIGQLYPDAIVIPGLVGGGTDSRHFTDVSENVYRFYPIRYTDDNKNGFHGINEYLTTSNYKECIQFVYQLIKNSNQ